MTNIKPQGNRLLVKPDVNAPKSALIAILDSSAEQPQTGVVIAISDKFENSTIVVSDYILFTKNAGHEIVIDGEKHRVLNLDDILAVIS